MKLKKKDFEQLYRYCKKVGPGDRYFKECEDKILASKNPEWNYLFARDINGADTKAHGQAIIESKDLKWNKYFAKGIEGADVRAHGQVFIESGNLQENCWFAMEARGADIEAHRQVINASGNKSWIDIFEETMPRKNNKTQGESKTPKNSENTNTDPYYMSKKLRKLVIERNKVKQTLGYNKSEKESI